MLGLAMRFFLTASILAADVGMFYTLTQHHLPEANRDVAFQLSGVMAAVTTLSLNWWFSAEGRQQIRDAFSGRGQQVPPAN